MCRCGVLDGVEGTQHCRLAVKQVVCLQHVTHTLVHLRKREVAVPVHVHVVEDLTALDLVVTALA